MPVKVITNKNKEEQANKNQQKKRSVVQRITGVQPKGKENIIIRVIKVMVMDVRLKFDKKYREDYNDYTRFCDLARGKH